MDDSVEKQKERQRHTWHELFSYTKPLVWLAILTLVLMLGNAGTNALMIYQSKVFVDTVVLQNLGDEAKEIQEVLRVISRFIIILSIILLANGIFKGAELYSVSRFGQTLLRWLRRDIFSHVQKLSLDFYEGEQTGRIMSYTTTDVMKLREFLQLQWPKMVQGTVQVLCYLGLMLYISWQLTLMGFIVFPILIILIQLGARAIRRISILVQEKLAEISSVLQESIANILVVKSFTAEEHEKARFEEENRQTYKAEMRRAGVQAILIPPMQFLAALGAGIFLYIGARQIRSGITISPGDLIAIVVLLQQLSTEAIKVGRGYFNLQESMAAADRIFSFLKLQPSIEDPPDAEHIEDPKGDVRFESVSFSYADSDEILHEIDLSAPPGKAIALVGASGAGKTSLVKLIPRFYDVDNGRVLVDGHDVRKLKLSELRSIMGIVPQETILFSGTVAGNIAYGKPEASRDEIEAAAKAANAHDFITALPDGYNTVVGERGTKLSGGQAQRVAIARAILKDPRILILDEATSSLDAESEKLVQTALDRLMKGRTSFVIAHRLSTILNSDEIVVMEAGRIIDRGPHEELLKRCDAYRRLYETQLSASSGVDHMNSE